MLCSGNFDHENPYRNQPVVLKYHTGSRLGHVHCRGFFLQSNEGWTLEKNEQ
jgi:hypothetical protein